MEERIVEVEDDDLLSIVTGLDGFDETYSESEFKHYLNAADDLSSTKVKDGWIFWRESESEINERIKSLLQDCLYPIDYMVQFWAAKEEGEQVNYLITSDQPFAVVGDDLYKGLCSYRKQCLNYIYYTAMGPVGRAYRSKHPEFSHDLRLYSTTEFPLGDFAARCGMRSYMAMPIFDLNNNQHCYGVLEFLYFGHQTISDLSLFLLSKGLRSVHTNHLPVSGFLQSEQLIEIAEIKKMVKRAMEVVPQLHLAVVWVSGKQCSDDISTDNLSCMEIRTNIVGSNNSFDYSYVRCIHNARKVNRMNKSSSFCGNICDFRISAENPRAHFAQLLRLSVRYEICLESMQNSNEVYIVEFFLQSNNNREDGSFVYMLSRIMERVLKSIKLSPGGQLGDHQELLVVDPPHALRHESINYTQERKNQLLEEINMFEVIEGYNEQFSLMDFTKYLQKTDLFFGEQKNKGGFFWRRNSFQPHGLTIYSSAEDKITYFMSQIIHKEFYCLVQFWAPKFEENRCYITTLDQPFAVGSLKKGLASFRKQSMEHVYYVDEGAKDEQVGPPGRVFRSGSPEFTPDLRLYSTTEFALRNHAARCYLRKYFVLPIFHIHEQEECIGVLEFVVFVEFADFPFEYVHKSLEAANLSASFQASHMQTNISDSRHRALREIEETLEVVLKIPQLHRAEVWATCTRCAFEKDNSSNCMELTRVMYESYEHIYWTMLKLSHIHTRKGITGMVLTSKNKSCFFRNSCHFSIVEQPLAHLMQNERIGSCFAICLQSTHTGNLVYVLEFFLTQGPRKYEYILSLLNFLIPILKKYLKSFTIASGQQLGDELAIEVPVFPGEDELILSEINGPQNKFKFVPYSVREHQHSGHQRRPIIIVDDTDSVTSTSHAEHLISSVAANSKKIKGGKKKKTGRLNLTLEALKPHFGTKLKDVAKELGVSKSTIKRACREYGIDRWPCNEKHKNNPSLFEVERADKDSQKNICLRQNLAQASTDQSSSSHLNVQTIKADTVIVKAKYDDDTIRFELGLPLGMEKLVKEVANRLKLEMGSFKLKYLDEENEDILLTRDSDLLHCPKYLTASGESFIKLFVRLSRK